MKQVSLLLSALLISMSGMAQMYLWQGGQSTPANLDSITFSANAKPDNTFIVKPSMATIQANYTLQLALTKNTLPATSYRWTSSNEGVAVVNEQGEITGIAAGMAIISATAGTRSQTCILTVVDITDLWLNTPKVSMTIGATKQLDYEWSPRYYDTPMAEWTSSNPTIASVDEQGLVTALSEGTATITAIHNDLTDSCIVTVIKPQNLSITLPSSYTVAIDDGSFSLTPKITPANISVGIDWTSSDNNVATVDGNGLVTPLSIGETTITATIKGTAVSSSCIVKVTTVEGSLTFTEAYIGMVDYDSTKTVVYEHSKLGTLNVCIAKGRIQLFTKGLYFNDSGSLDGAKRGGWIYINAPIALAFPDKNKDNTNMAQYPNGVSFSIGDYSIDLDLADTVEVKWHHAQKGYVDNQKFMGYMNKWLADFNKVGKFTQENYKDFAYAGIYGFRGTKLILKQYAADETTGKGEYESYPDWLWEYTPNGIVTDGELYVSGKEGSSRFMQKIDYMNVNVKLVATDTTGIPGVYAAIENNKYVLKSTSVEFGEERNYITGEKPADAPAKARGNGGINIFIDHIIPRVSDLPAMNTTNIILPEEANLLSVKK